MCLVVHLFGKRTDADNGIDSFVYGILAYLFVSLVFVFALFEHVSEYCNGRSDGFRQKIESRLHGFGACIVTVIKNGDAVFLNNIVSSCQCLYAGYSKADLLCGHIKNLSNAYCSQSIHNHVLSCKGHADIKDSVSVFYGTFASPKTSVDNLCGMNFILFVKTEGNNLFALDLFEGCESFVIAAYTYVALRVHMFKNLCLCFEDSIKRSECFKMACTYIGDDANIRFGNFGKLGHLAKLAYAHLEDGHLIVFFNIQNG